MTYSFLLALSFIATADPARVDAQHAGAAPRGWEWRLDRTTASPATDSSRLDRMPPGWHITTGPAGLLYPSAERAAAPFTLVADFVVFPTTTESGFGLFLGGADLESDSSSYIAALLRRDGAITVVRRSRGADSTLVPWTSHTAIRPHPGSGTTTNRLRLSASADSLRVFVNDSAVVALGLDDSAAAGRFGFRVGERVNLHITILDYIRHLAPLRSRTR